MIIIGVFLYVFTNCNFFGFFFSPLANGIEISKWATFYIGFISLNHYISPYLISDIIKNNNLKIIEWTFMECFIY
jgi:hypothetical protein